MAQCWDLTQWAWPMDGSEHGQAGAGRWKGGAQGFIVQAGPPSCLALPPWRVRDSALDRAEMWAPGSCSPGEGDALSLPSAPALPGRDPAWPLPRVWDTECRPYLEKGQDSPRPSELRAGDGLRSLGGQSALRRTSRRRRPLKTQEGQEGPPGMGWPSGGAPGCWRS